MGGEKGRRGDPGETGRGDREGLVSQRREFEFYSERLGKRRRVEGTDTSDQPTNQPTGRECIRGYSVARSKRTGHPRKSFRQERLLLGGHSPRPERSDEDGFRVC